MYLKEYCNQADFRRLCCHTCSLFFESPSSSPPDRDTYDHVSYDQNYGHDYEQYDDGINSEDDDGGRDIVDYDDYAEINLDLPAVTERAQERLQDDCQYRKPNSRRKPCKKNSRHRSRREALIPPGSWTVEHINRIGRAKLRQVSRT